jgi:recombinational DNA repair protein RecT
VTAEIDEHASTGYSLRKTYGIFYQPAIVLRGWEAAISGTIQARKLARYTKLSIEIWHCVGADDLLVKVREITVATSSESLEE